MFGFGAVTGRFLTILFLSAATVLGFVSMERPFTHCHHRTTEAATSVSVAEFGVEEWVDGEGYIFTDTKRVPLVDGTTFGWRLRLNTPDSVVLLREEFVLPSPPAYWGISPDTALSDDRRVAVTERLVAPENGWLDGRWTVTQGDPVGDYEMRVFLDGQIVRVFRFTAENASE